MKTKRYGVSQGHMQWGEVDATTEKEAIKAAIKKFNMPVRDRKHLSADELIMTTKI